MFSHNLITNDMFTDINVHRILKNMFILCVNNASFHCINIHLQDRWLLNMPSCQIQLHVCKNHSRPLGRAALVLLPLRPPAVSLSLSFLEIASDEVNTSGWGMKSVCFIYRTSGTVQWTAASQERRLILGNAVVFVEYLMQAKERSL